jgi:hypothetical protein
MCVRYAILFFIWKELCISLLPVHVHLSVEEKNRVSLDAASLENNILSKLFPLWQLFPLWSCKTCFFTISHKYRHFL